MNAFLMRLSPHILLFFMFLGFVSKSNSQILKKHRDSIDGAIDLSHFLGELNGVLPIVAPITEPAVGYGAVAAGLYFIPKKNNVKDVLQRPDIAGIGGGYTANGTWFAGGGYIGFWNQDKLRYRGVVGYGDINLNYHSPIINQPKEFNMASFFLLQQAVLRIGKSDFFLGGKYQLTKTNVRFLTGSDIPEIDSRDFELWNSGISLISEYENLNNVFSPTKGMRIHFSYDQNLEFLGSDKNWGKLNFFSQMYFPVSTTWIPAIRVESHLATDDIPFYAKPFIALRGVPVLRYQGDLSVLAETEQMFNLDTRWSIVAFTGIGTTFENVDNLKAEELVWNAGGGFRYLIARLFGIKMGLDIARGPEDWAVYVVFGTSWLR